MSEWDLWVDFHRTDVDGLTHAHVDDLRSGVPAFDGGYLLTNHQPASRAAPGRQQPSA